jgi:hypothetical protein
MADIIYPDFGRSSQTGENADAPKPEGFLSLLDSTMRNLECMAVREKIGKNYDLISNMMEMYGTRLDRQAERARTQNQMDNWTYEDCIRYLSAVDQREISMHPAYCQAVFIQAHVLAKKKSEERESEMIARMSKAMEGMSEKEKEKIITRRVDEAESKLNKAIAKPKTYPTKPSAAGWRFVE